MVNKVIAFDKNGEGVICCTIVGIEYSAPCVVKALPESNIKTKWWDSEVVSYIKALYQCGFKGSCMW